MSARDISIRAAAGLCCAFGGSTMNTSKPATTPRAVVILALSLVAFSLLNVILLSVVSDPPLAKSIQRGVRFLFTCLLAYFLWRGARWARWVSFVIAALAVITSFVGFAALPESVPALFRIWMAVMGVFYLVVALALVIPSPITRYYTSS
jgi:peptidoglycan/LPS O-acetylase OafA/YrhL